MVVRLSVGARWGPAITGGGRPGLVHGLEQRHAPGGESDAAVAFESDLGVDTNGSGTGGPWR